MSSDFKPVQLLRENQNRSNSEEYTTEAGFKREARAVSPGAIKKVGPALIQAYIEEVLQ